MLIGIERLVVVRRKLVHMHFSLREISGRPPHLFPAITVSASPSIRTSMKSPTFCFEDEIMIAQGMASDTRSMIYRRKRDAVPPPTETIRDELEIRQDINKMAKKQESETRSRSRTDGRCPMMGGFDEPGTRQKGWIVASP